MVGHGLTRTRLIIFLLLALGLHGLILFWAPRVWQPSSQIKLMAQPIYARLITPKEPAALPRARAEKAPAGSPRAAVNNNDAVALRSLPANMASPVPTAAPTAAPPVKPDEKSDVKPDAQKPVIPPPPDLNKPLFAPLGDDQPKPLPTQPIEQTEPFNDALPSPAPTRVPTLTPTPTPVPTATPAPVPTAPAGNADAGGAGSGANTSGTGGHGAPNSTGTSDAYPEWPADTLITLKATGNYRGAVTGKAKVSWQRQQDRYQAQVSMDFGLASLTMTSQGQVTPDGLNPSIFEETALGRLRSARFDAEAVTIGNGKRIPRNGLPGGMGTGSFQDSASQFVELAHRFATGANALAAGSSVSYWLGRPEGLYQYIFDISGPEPLSLPKLGTVQVWHLTPRPIPGLNKEAIYGEMWIAPSLQYLPVKIRMRNDAGMFLDLLVDTVEQGEKKNPLAAPSASHSP